MLLARFERLVRHSALVLVLRVQLFVVVVGYVTEIGLIRLLEVWIPSNMGCYILFNPERLTVELDSI